MADESILSDLVEIEPRKPIETQSSLLKRTPITGISTLHKTKTYKVHSGINPLVTIATPIFTLMSKLRQLEHHRNVLQLKDQLIHEIKAFECAAQEKDYRAEMILIARYVICSSLDEIVMNTSWGDCNEWKDDTLLQIFQNEAWGGERFFVILERLSEDPKYYIDVLELIYLCLSLGFEGHFRYMERGSIDLNKVIDDLYHLIRRQRGDFRKKLSPEIKTAKTLAPPKNHTSLWQIATFTGIILFSVYIGFNYLVNMTTQPIVKQAQTIQHQQKS